MENNETPTTKPKRQRRPRADHVVPGTPTPAAPDAPPNEHGGASPTPSPAVPRQEMRKPMRDEDPRDAAAKRTAEILGHLNGDLGDAANEFYFDISIIPDGWTYEWKRHTVFNKEDPGYTVQLRRTGWEPVTAGRHPDMMPIGTPPDAPIERKGQMLMQRPQEITDRVMKIDSQRARDQVRVKEAQLNAAPDGQFSRTEDARTKPVVRKSYEAMPVPKE